MAIAVKVNRINRFADEKGKTKAFVDIEINDLILIKGLKVLDGKNGIFVSMPRQRGKDGLWYEIVRPIAPETKAKIEEVVLAAYEAKDEQQV